MCQVTPNTSQIDRRLKAAREAMGSRHLLEQKVERLTPKPTTADLRHRWEQINKLERGVA